MRDTPPSIQDGFPDPSSAMTNMAMAQGIEPIILTPEMASKLGRECYEASTQWLNSGRRASWNDNLRAFQGLHPSQSKYLSTDYRYRSKLYRPKTRTMVRKDEAQTAAAFFANQDVVDVQPEDDNDPKQLASAAIMKELLQYRLTKTIPWFLTLLGARQDAEVMGVCIGKAYWRYEEEFSHTEPRVKLDPETGTPVIGENGPELDQIDVHHVTEDKPCIDLVAPENFRFDPGADWRNPVATSPYLIEIIPMYALDVQAKIDSGEWLPVSSGALMASTDIDDDVTRRSREQGRVPGKDDDVSRPRDYQICWVRENILRYGGKDWHYLTLGSAGELLTDPRPLKEVYLQGVRPYTCGFVVLEAHKTYPSAKVELVRDLQMMANDDMNLRFDNVKLALNPRQFIKAGQGIEITDVRNFAPGKVVVTKNPREDIVWDRPPEVTASSYQEQDRINMDFDELAGAAGPSTMASASNPVVPDTVGGMDHIAAPGNTMNDYEMGVFNVTFVEPMLRQLVKMEQAYETNAVVLALAGNKAQLFQKFGIDEITDDLLGQELTMSVNVGVGSTNPQQGLKNFVMGVTTLAQIFSSPQAAMALEFEEVQAEIFGKLGYKDGSRFVKPGFDPMQALQMMMQMKGGGQQQPGQGAPDPHRLEAVGLTAKGKIQQTQIKAQSDEKIAAIDFQKNALSEEADTKRAMLNMFRELVTAKQPTGPHPIHAGQSLTPQTPVHGRA